MLRLLEISVSLIFFTNKVLVLAGKKFGWLVGSIAAVLAAIYFYLLGFYVYTALELGLIVLMGYGFFKSSKKNLKVEVLIRFVIVVVMLALSVFVFQGKLTIIEFVSSLGMLWGTFFLTHDRVRLGWILYASANIGSAYLGFQKEQQFFMDFQIASAIVCATGAVVEKKV